MNRIKAMAQWDKEYPEYAPRPGTTIRMAVARCPICMKPQPQGKITCTCQEAI